MGPSRLFAASLVLSVLVIACGDTTPVPTPMEDPPSAGNIFYVSSTRGNNANAGSSTAPFGTIQRGIDAAAAAGGGIVRVAGGTYNDSLTLRSNLQLVGGFTPDTWSPIRRTSLARSTGAGPR